LLKESDQECVIGCCVLVFAGKSIDIVCSEVKSIVRFESNDVGGDRFDGEEEVGVEGVVDEAECSVGVAGSEKTLVGLEDDVVLAGVTVDVYPEFFGDDSPDVFDVAGGEERGN
jgi:hypothetical protein